VRNETNTLVCEYILHFFLPKKFWKFFLYSWRKQVYDSLIPVITYDFNDAQSVATCAWKEARGDGMVAMRAVMHVIANRVGAPGFAATVHDVVYGKNQFTSMSVPSDPEFNLDPARTEGQDKLAYQYCLSLVDKVLSGADPDISNGARYYSNINDVTSGWFWREVIHDPVAHPFRAKIGRQVFYE
jgi:spore germination cell wall hydrolase CwlJ-like protein